MKALETRSVPTDTSEAVMIQRPIAFPLVLRRLATLAICALLSTSPAAAQPRPAGYAREPIIGGPCEGCEGVFEGLPASLPSVTRIAPPGETGQPMIIDGIVRDQVGTPVAGVIVYAYHTDASGIYRPIKNAPGASARRHGQLRGWAITDSLGRYQFITIRPGHYPQRNAPQHVHMHVIEPRCCTYYIGSIVFSDDPLLTDAARDKTSTDRGGSGLANPTRGADGIWHVRRDIRLGAGVPGYERHAAARDAPIPPHEVETMGPNRRDLARRHPDPHPVHCPERPPTRGVLSDSVNGVAQLDSTNANAARRE